MHPDVCAVMVTYNPDPNDFEQNLRALLPQVGKLIIVDNQSGPTAHSFIAQTAAAVGVEVIWNKQNLGIAGGLNAGIERALSNSQCAWIAAFDQDSLVPRDYVKAIFEAYSACPFRGKVAVVGASYSNPIYERCGQWVAERNDFEFREIKSVMTSGSLVKISALNACGRFDESLFMDYVDHDFCLRLRKHGFKVIQAGNAVLVHQLGSPTLHRFLGKRFLSSNHSPGRRYHNARNRILVYRRFLRSETSWVLADALGWIREMVKVALVERNRTEKFINVAAGIWDATTGRKTKRLEKATKAGPSLGA
jgi:rhamnosyltransferase